jgi:predicted phosphodiesterase
MYNFRTAPNDMTTPLRFSYLTDPQIYVTEVSRIKAVYDKIHNDNPHLIMVGGDHVADSTVARWQALMMAELNALHYAFTADAEGNHDGVGLNTYYGFPQPMAYPNTYSFNFGMAHIIVINTNYDSSSQLATLITWMTADLAKHQNDKWRIVLLHKALYSVGGHYNEGDIVPIRNTLGPVFQKNNINLVLQGHDHAYSRTCIAPNGTRSVGMVPPCTVYYLANTASVDQRYSLFGDGASPMTYDIAASVKDQTYANLDVTQDTIKVTAYNYNGSSWYVYDTFVVTK